MLFVKSFFLQFTTDTFGHFVRGDIVGKMEHQHRIDAFFFGAFQCFAQQDFAISVVAVLQCN